MCRQGSEEDLTRTSRFIKIQESMKYREKCTQSTFFNPFSEDKQGRKYCVACEEIDCEENSKDNPAVNAQAARNQIAEGRLEETESQVEEPVARVESQVEEPVVRVQHVSQRNANPTLSMNRSNGLVRLSGGGASSLPSQPVSVIHSGLDSVFSKLDSASQSLMETQDIETSRQLVLLIKDCADCLLSLKNAAVAHQ